MLDTAAFINISEHRGTLIARGSAVELNGRGLLVVGAPGTGKSEMAVALMAYGARLIGDDGVALRVGQNGVVLSPPLHIGGHIEIRGVGILGAETVSARLYAVLNLDKIETERLPPMRMVTVLGQKVALLHKVESAHFPAAIKQYMLSERIT